MYTKRLLSLILLETTGIFGIAIYEMQDMCGQQLNMRWKDIYSGEVRLNSALQSRATNISRTKSTDTEPGPYISKYEIASGVVLCSVTIESWDFLDRVMFYFKDVKFAPKCTEARLEIYDGPTHTSRPVAGIERPICNQRRRRFAGKTFMTSDKYLTLRLIGNSAAVKNVTFTMVLVSFHDGDCRSYEHQCASGICIMEELVCSGHNPCGDKSDCPVLPTEVAAEEPHVINAAIITASIFLLGVIIGLVLFFKCYRHRLKLRRQRLHQIALETTEGSPITAEEGVEQNANDEVIQNEAAAQLFSPPSYNSLKVIANETRHDDFDECIEKSKNSTLPPSYSCVMLHQDKFHLSYTDLSKIKLSNMQKVSLSDSDVHTARS